MKHCYQCRSICKSNHYEKFITRNGIPLPRLDARVLEHILFPSVLTPFFLNFLNTPRRIHAGDGAYFCIFPPSQHNHPSSAEPNPLSNPVQNHAPRFQPVRGTTTLSVSRPQGRARGFPPHGTMSKRSFRGVHRAVEELLPTAPPLARHPPRASSVGYLPVMRSISNGPLIFF